MKQLTYIFTFLLFFPLEAVTLPRGMGALPEKNLPLVPPPPKTPEKQQSQPRIPVPFPNLPLVPSPPHKTP